MRDQDRNNEIKNIWQTIRLRMNERRLTPAELSLKTPYSKEHIERGIDGEPVSITLDFLRDCVMALGLASARAKFYEETDDILTFEECVRLIKPPPAMLPLQGDFWDYI